MEGGLGGGVCGFLSPSVDASTRPLTDDIGYCPVRTLRTTQRRKFSRDTPPGWCRVLVFERVPASDRGSDPKPTGLCTVCRCRVRPVTLRKGPVGSVPTAFDVRSRWIVVCEGGFSDPKTKGPVTTVENLWFTTFIN